MVTVNIWDYNKTLAELIIGPTDVLRFEDKEQCIKAMETLIQDRFAEPGVTEDKSIPMDEDSSVLTFGFLNADGSRRMVVVAFVDS